MISDIARLDAESRHDKGARKHARTSVADDILPCTPLPERQSRNLDSLTRLRGLLDVSDTADESMIQFDFAPPGYI